MSWTAYYTHSNETDVFYVELTPTGASPVRVAGTRNTNKLRQWSFGPLTDGAAYDLILQAGASPASTDTVYGAINNDAATAATQATAAASQTTQDQLKAGARSALAGRWQNNGTGSNYDDVSVGEVP